MLPGYTGYENCTLDTKQLTEREIKDAYNAGVLGCDGCNIAESDNWYTLKRLSNGLPITVLLCTKCMKNVRDIK